MTIRNRELSQFGSFIFIDNNTKDIGITTLSTPFVGIGTTNATSKFHVYGDTKLEGNVNLTGISTFDSNVFVGSAVSIYSSTGIISATEFKGAVTGDVDGNAGTATSLATARDFSITGDFVTATAVSFDGTGNVSLAATITADSIELGTYTSGDYVASISGTANQVSVDVTSGEGTTPTISLPNDVELPGNLKVTSGLTTVSSLTLQNVGIAVTAILDEDGLTSDRDDALATQQSIKSYVDAQVDLQDLDVQGDTGGALSIDLDTEILEIAGTTNEIETVGSGNSITIGLPNEVEISDSLTVGSATTINSSGIIAGIVTGTLDNTLTLNTSGSGISGSTTYNNSGVSTFTVTSNATSADTPSTIVFRDGSGDFSAGTITADLTGVASTATKLETTRDFSVSGDVATSSGVSFDGTSNVDLPVTLSNTFSANTSGIITSTGGFVGDIIGDLTGVASTATKLQNARDFSITGSFITASAVSFDGTANVALGATITPDSITLGTYTTGDYVQSITGTANEIEVTGGTGESSTPQIGLPDDVTIGGDLTVTGLTTTNTLYVAGVSTFNGVLNTNSSVSIGSTVNATAYYQNGSLLVDAALQQWEDATLDSGTSIYRDLGNVGIGTSTNLAKLSVNGQIESQATSGTAPFIVQSQTTVENLSAKLLDGKSAPTGDIVGTSDSQTLTTKTINLSNNTLSGTTAEFNTALSDDDFATLNNSVTLTNKTLTSPAISTITDGGSGSQDIPAGIGTLVSTSSVGIITSGMIKDGEIVNADVSASAAIDYSKLNLSGSIVDGDITTGTIANDKLANSTISGISLGSNLANLTRGTDVLYSSGTTYNGGSAITISVDSSTAATANKIVKRDADGGITANDITAGAGYTFYGDGSGIENITADVAVKVSTADTSTAGPFYLTFVDSNNTPASYESLFTDGGISYDALTADLSVNGSVSATGGFNIGIQSAGVEQTTGVVTAINFIGLGNTFNYNAGTKTIDVSIESGSGGGDSLWESYAAGISTTSNVGIGTTNPEAKLSIDVGAGITALDIQGSEGQLFSVTNNLTSGSIFSVNDVSGLPSIDVDADGTIELATYGGNVGIATTNPTSTLDVNGTLNVSGVSTFQGNVSIGTDTNLTAKLTVGGIQNTSVTDKGATAFKTLASDGGVGESAIYLEEQSGSEGWYLKVNSSGDLQFNDSGTSDRITFQDGGNVGIGTDNPTAKLDVNGTLNVSGVTTISVNSTEDALRITQTGGGSALVVEDSANPDATPFEVTGSGDVRVGRDLIVQEGDTSNISHKAFYNDNYWSNDVARFAHASGHSQVAVFANYTNAQYGSEISILRSYSNNVGSDSTVSVPGRPIGGIKFGASISNQMVQAGFFGAFLSESGTFNDTSKPTDFRFYTNPNGAIIPTEKVRITSEGNVGIGSTLPTQKLDVNGSVAIGASIYDSNGSSGTDGQVLSNVAGIGVSWVDGGAAGGGGSSDGGDFNSGITTTKYASASNDIDGFTAIAVTFPSTAGRTYLVESIHVTNITAGDLYITSRIDYDGGENVPFTNKVLIPEQGAIDIVDESIICNPSDNIRLAAYNGIGVTAAGILNGLDCFVTYTEKTDTNYIGIGSTTKSAFTDETVFTSNTNPSVINTIVLTNNSDVADLDVSVSMFRGGTIRQGYFVYNLTVPQNSSVQILPKAKRLNATDTIVVNSSSTSLGINVAGKYIT